MTFPHVKKLGSAQVTIYRTPVKTRGKKYDAYTVRYYFEGKPQQKKFGKFKNAETHADEILGRIGAGTLAVMQMTEYDRAQWHESIKLADGRITPLAAVKYWLERHPSNITPRKISEIIPEMMAQKKQDKLSDSWLINLQTRLKTFSDKFGAKNAGEITGIQIDDWLRSKEISIRSRNNYRCAISTLISFAKRRRYLPRDWHELETVLIGKTKDAPIEIFTPKEMRALLDGATDKQTLFLILGGFAGLRSQEITRLDWNEIGETHIEITAAKAKTAARRLVPISANLRSWLEPFRQEGVKVLPGRDLAHLAEYIAKRTKTPWKHNALRHSYISYRVALIKSVGEVALEAGTSERKIFQNYRKLVTEDQAKEWFSIYKTVTKNSAAAKDA